MSALAHLIEQALQHHRAGRLPEAYDLYKQVLAREPDNVDALTLLGTLASQLGDLPAAEALLVRAVMLDPLFPAAQVNLATLYQAAGRTDLAWTHMQRAVELAPEDSGILGNAAFLAWQSGDRGLAGEHARKALELDPGNAHANNVAALVAMYGGAWAEARRHLDTAVAINPDYVEAWANRGRTCQALGDLEGALESFLGAIRLRQTDALLWRSLADCMAAFGRTEDAAGLYAHTQALAPQDAEVLKNWGAMLAQTRDWDGAAEKARAGLVLAPQDPALWNNLGVALSGGGQLAEAITALRRAVEIAPEAWEYRHHLSGRLMNDLGDAEAALPHLQALMRLRPGTPQHSGALMGMQYCASVAVGQIAAAHREYAMMHPGSGLTGLGREDAGGRPRAPGQRLRIGFLSGDFRRHATARFLPPILTRRAALGWDAILYSLTPHEDEETARFRDMADAFVEVKALDDAALARRIAADDLDVLFDLSGHTRFGAPALFRYRMARWQGGWLGLDYVWENGLPELDFILTDAQHVPEQENDLFRAQVLRLPHAYCYEAPADAPPVGPLPALSGGGITFGCLNALFKVGDGVIAQWARILGRVPGSRLALGAPQLDHADSRTRIIGLFARHGISGDRLTLLGSTDPVGMLHRYQQIDIALDPFPYAGGLTTLEALWMGVPVVTVPGDRPAGRHSFSHLTAAGFTDLIATDPAALEEKVVALAADLPALAAWRAAARGRMQASSLCDGDRYAATFTGLMRTLVEPAAGRA